MPLLALKLHVYLSFYFVWNKHIGGIYEQLRETASLFFNSFKLLFSY